jgi:hypothetical protein
MTLHPIPSEFLYTWVKIYFIFYQCYSKQCLAGGLRQVLQPKRPLYNGWVWCCEMSCRRKYCKLFFSYLVPIHYTDYIHYTKDSITRFWRESFSMKYILPSAPNTLIFPLCFYLKLTEILRILEKITSAIGCWFLYYDFLSSKRILSADVLL